MVESRNHSWRWRAVPTRSGLSGRWIDRRVASHRNRGFSTMELMVSIAIVGILSALAVPALMTMIATQRIKSATFDLYAAVSYARSEAIKRNAAVTIAPVAGDFAKGYTVAASAGTVVLRTNVGSPAVTIDTKPTPLLGGFTFDGFGRQTSPVSSLQLTPTVSGVSGRCLVISPSGRASIRVGSCP